MHFDNGFKFYTNSSSASDESCSSFIPEELSNSTIACFIKSMNSLIFHVGDGHFEGLLVFAL